MFHTCTNLFPPRSVNVTFFEQNRDLICQIIIFPRIEFYIHVGEVYNPTWNWKFQISFFEIWSAITLTKRKQKKYYQYGLVTVLQLNNITQLCCWWHAVIKQSNYLKGIHSTDLNLLNSNKLSMCTSSTFWNWATPKSI